MHTNSNYYTMTSERPTLSLMISLEISGNGKPPGDARHEAPQVTSGDSALLRLTQLHLSLGCVEEIVKVMSMHTALCSQNEM